MMKIFFKKCNLVWFTVLKAHKHYFVINDYSRVEEETKEEIGRSIRILLTTISVNNDCVLV